MRAPAGQTPQPNRLDSAHNRVNELGQPIGTLCVISPECRNFTDEDIATLQLLARQVEHLLALRDLSQQLYQRNIELEQATNAKSRFLSTMSHDIRTPINGIIGAAELLSEERMSNEQREHVGVIQACSQSLLHLVNNILDLSKIESGVVDVDESSFSIADLLNDAVQVIRDLAQQKNLSLKIDIDASLPSQVIADKRRVHQIILNLLSNAVKFTEYGSIHVTAAALGDRLELVSSIQVSVSAKMTLRKSNSHSFNSQEDRYRRIMLCTLVQDWENNRPASGRNTWRGMADNQHGKNRNKNCFSLPVQLVDDENETLRDDNAAITQLPSELNIAIVDDNTVNRPVLEKILKRFGCVVVTHASGESCVESYRSGQRPDLVLMDCQMPGMDGFAATAALRECH